VIPEPASFEDAASLTPAQRAQLTKAAPELLGHSTLAKLFAALGDDEHVVLARIDVDGVARWDAWLLGALEVGVFFVHGARSPSGLAISQGEVHDQTKKKREDEVRVLQAAMKSLRLPPRKKRR